MRLRPLFENQFGISLMYDTVFFIVMISLAGAILLPVLRSDIARNSSIDIRREEMVGDILHTYLVTRADFFEYRFCGNLIDDVAGRIGIDNTSDGLYGSLTRWVFAHEQYHKTYATLLAEYLGSQFKLPWTMIGTNQLNVFVNDFNTQLKNETKRFISSCLGKKYHFNFTAWWHPIRAVPFGGEFSIGESPPKTDCYAAQIFFMMPYTPVFTVENHTIPFTKHWLKHHLFSNTVGFGTSSIPVVTNITRILENYSNNHSPYDTKAYASKVIKENLSELIHGFLVKGIVNETNVTIFPGIIHTTLLYGFEKIKDIPGQIVSNRYDESFGGSIRSIDHLFGGLNSSAINGLSEAILGQLNTTLQQMLNRSFTTVFKAFEACEAAIKERIINILEGCLDSFLEAFVNFVFDIIDTIVNFADMLIDWLVDSVSLNRAEVMLTIWVVRE